MTRIHRLLPVLGATALLLAGPVVAQSGRISVEIDQAQRVQLSGPAGSVIVGLVLLHSLVDYPIRTAAIAAIFAMGCALIVPARPSRREREGHGEHEAARHLKVTGAEE